MDSVEKNSNIDEENFPSKTGVRFRKEIGLLEAVAIIVSSIIGTGIFISPKGILAQSGSPGMALLIWIIYGIIATSGAMTLMELQLSMPSSGGYYFYFLEVGGPFTAFLYLWIYIFIFVPIGITIMAIAFGKYVTSSIFTDPDFPAPQISVQLLGTLLIIFLAFLNCYDVRLVARVQKFFMLGKMIPLILIILIGIWSIVSGQGDIISSISFHGTNVDPGKIAFALYYGFYTYEGWDNLSYITEELKNPNKTMPRAIYLAVPVITAIYVLANIGYLLILTPSEFLSSNAVAVTFLEKIHPTSGWIISIFVSMSIAGTISAYGMVTPRLLFVGARHGQFPSMFALMSKSKMTPIPAIIFLSSISFFYLWTSTDIFVLIDYTTYVKQIQFLGILAIFIYLRVKKPNLHRPIKVSLFHPILFGCSTLFMGILPIITNPLKVGTGIGIGLCGIPVYFLFFHWNGNLRKEVQSFQLTSTITKFFQKVFLCLPED